MLLMNREEVERELKKINEYLKDCSWMFFEFCRMNAGQVVVAGLIDESSNDYAIDIEFNEPFFVSSLFIWEADLSEAVIQLATEEEEHALDAVFHIEKGNYIFKINAVDYKKPPVYIAAKKINCKINIEDPFHKKKD